MTVNCRIILIAWREKSKLNAEIENAEIFIPELLTAIKDGHRSREDWYTESLNMDAVESFIHEDALKHITETPVIYEAIGEYSVSGSKDYYGEYDEESTFIIADWHISENRDKTEFVF